MAKLPLPIDELEDKIARQLANHLETHPDVRIPKGSGGSWKCDMRVCTPFKRLVIVEYDGQHHHAGPAHEAQDRAKTKALTDAGHYVMRIREDPLGALDPVNDLCVSRNPDPAQVARQVAERLTAEAREIDLDLDLLDVERDHRDAAALAQQLDPSERARRTNHLRKTLGHLTAPYNTTLLALHSRIVDNRVAAVRNALCDYELVPSARVVARKSSDVLNSFRVAKGLLYRDRNDLLRDAMESTVRHSQRPRAKPQMAVDERGVFRRFVERLPDDLLAVDAQELVLRAEHLLTTLKWDRLIDAKKDRGEVQELLDLPTREVTDRATMIDRAFSGWRKLAPDLLQIELDADWEQNALDVAQHAADQHAANLVSLGGGRYRLTP